jgi:hypothetical protein
LVVEQEADDENPHLLTRPALACGNDLDIRRWQGQQPAIAHIEMFPLEI